MKVNLEGRSFLTLMDFAPREIRYLLDLAKELKAKRRKGLAGGLLKGRNILLIFEKNSTRTRCAFETGAAEEGACVTVLDSASSHFGKKESLEDSARVFGRFYDGIGYRGFQQSVVEGLAKYSGVPVWNGLTDVDHPTQILADLMTIEEHQPKPLSEVKVVFCGDTRNNMSYAWMYGCAKMGMKFAAYGPEALEPDRAVLAGANAVADESGASISFVSDEACLEGADVIYTDVWASMGEDERIPERVKQLSPYKVTMETLAKTKNPEVLFMHCLPAFHDFETGAAKEQMARGYDIREVSDEVFRCERSVVFDEAENRMHSIKAVMAATLRSAI
ncbi:MAG: ornithine carbamoyltransferase [Clostridiales Family XIII bacterium]|jgi:ornithine carbamoyltransferase|nr:ornithine carbamoyltransferase [Clostridiales Family XIII bacterium]